jgi:peptidoglycan/xylan/chitin deacetylase (PgdA/CDA1 family)
VTRARRPLILVLVALLAGCGSSPGEQRQAAPATTTAAGGSGGAAKPARTIPTLTAPANPPARIARVPILTYHRVHEYATEQTKSIPDLTIEPPTFVSEMEALDRAGYHTITQKQLFDALYDGVALPSKPVLLTFDDGYVDHVDQVLPVLKRHHMVATFYVVTQRVHEAGFVTAAQIRELEAAGMDVGSHTRTHASLPALTPAALHDELSGSQEDLRRILGHRVYWFAYPFGTFNPTVVEAVRRAGFLLATTTQGGTSASTSAPLEIPRLHVGRNATASTVLGLVNVGGGGSAPGTG